ncbi:MAG TPA: polysaccharide biosynthesis/export family protein [Syntrophorhabdus sp.]|nr:polysaccharide biosynthesis/export family protein [Syntrophorhabdus sp.]HQM25571.1 polysaccharide biosynthesis/export family protein [Syntrophorhabdus sp.]
MKKKLFANVFCLALFFVVAFLAEASAQDDYVIGPEDEISITVWDHPDLTRKIRVNLEGKISFPLIGEVPVGGLTTIEIEKKIGDLLNKDYIINPQVSVVIESYKSSKVSIMGEVKMPGPYALTRRMNVVEALSMAGGLLSEADHEIMIVRPKKSDQAGRALLPEEVEDSEIIRIQIRDMLQREGDMEEKARNIEVRNGDTIFVPKARMFYVTGEVMKPGQYAYQRGMSLLHAISTAGGFTEKARRSKVKVVRQSQGKKVELSLTLDKPIEPGDTVIVPESFW